MNKQFFTKLNGIKEFVGDLHTSEFRVKITDTFRACAFATALQQCGVHATIVGHSDGSVTFKYKTTLRKDRQIVQRAQDLEGLGEAVE